MKTRFIFRFLLFTALFSLPFFSIGQSRSAVHFKKVFYENDSTMFATNTINYLNTTADSSYFIGGSQITNTDLNGNVVWNSGLSNNFIGTDAIPYFSPDGRYFVLQGNFKFINVDANENVLWQKFLVDTSCYCIHPKHITQTSDGGFIITGFKSVNDTAFYRDRIFVVKTNSSGDTIWTRTIAKTPYDNDGYYAQETSDGGYLILANVEISPSPDYKIGILKLNSNGQEEWYKTAAHSIYYLARITGIKTADSACVIVSSSDSIVESTYFLKIKENGDDVFDTIYMGKKFNGGILEQANGTYLIGMQDSLSEVDGVTNSILWSKAYIGAVGENIPITAVKPAYNNGYMLAGNSAQFRYGCVQCGGQYNYYHFFSYLINTDSSLTDVNLPSGINEIIYPSTNLIIYPNPFNTTATIYFEKEQSNCVFKIKDVIGREIFTTHFSGNQLVIEKGEMKPGVYFVQIQMNTNTQTINKKIILQ